MEINSNLIASNCIYFISGGASALISLNATKFLQPKIINTGSKISCLVFIIAGTYNMASAFIRNDYYPDHQKTKQKIVHLGLNGLTLGLSLLLFSKQIKEQPKSLITAIITNQIITGLLCLTSSYLLENMIEHTDD